MKSFETSQHASLLANNDAQDREIRRLQSEVNQMAADQQALNNYCGQLEGQNEQLRKQVARYEMFKTATKAWGY